MKLIEANKVEQAIKDYWKTQVDKVPVPKSIKEHCEYTNHLDAIERHNYNMLKIIDELPPALQQQWIPVTEESVIQAGYEGREMRFRLRGRLFAIRELAQ